MNGDEDWRMNLILNRNLIKIVIKSSSCSKSRKVASFPDFDRLRRRLCEPSFALRCFTLFLYEKSIELNVDAAHVFSPVLKMKQREQWSGSVNVCCRRSIRSVCRCRNKGLIKLFSKIFMASMSTRTTRRSLFFHEYYDICWTVINFPNDWYYSIGMRTYEFIESEDFHIIHNFMWFSVNSSALICSRRVKELWQIESFFYFIKKNVRRWLMALTWFRINFFLSITQYWIDLPLGVQNFSFLLLKKTFVLEFSASFFIFHFFGVWQGLPSLWSIKKKTRMSLMVTRVEKW